MECGKSDMTHDACSETRRKYIPVGLGPASMRATVSEQASRSLSMQAGLKFVGPYFRIYAEFIFLVKISDTAIQIAWWKIDPVPFSWLYHRQLERLWSGRVVRSE